MMDPGTFPPELWTEWTGTADLASSFPLDFGRIRVEDPGDAALLRGLRELDPSPGNGAHALVSDDGVFLEIGVADVLPYDLELARGRDRPW